MELVEEVYNMDHYQVIVKTPTKTFEGRVIRMAVYLQSRLLEITGSNHTVFYLVYYKDRIIGGKEISQIEKASFLDRALRCGIVFDAPHPLIPNLLPKNRTVSIPNLKNLFNQLQNQFTLQEVAHAATFLDNFIEKKQLIEIIRKIYYHFRRNGQMFNAYQILRILDNFDSETNWTNHITNPSELQKYEIHYQKPESLLDKDPLFVEQFCYHNREQTKYEILLHTLLKNQSRWFERIALSVNRFETKKEFYDYQEFFILVKDYLCQEDLLALLQFLYRLSPSYLPIIQDLLEELVQTKHYSEALALMKDQTKPFPPSQHKLIETIMENLDPDSASIDLNNVNHILVPLFPTNPEKKEAIIHRFVAYLLNKHNVQKVKDWLAPFKENNLNSRITHEVNKIAVLSNDLDRQMELGELYYQLGLLDKAVECFLWEMELKPSDPNPVRWLSKIYNEKGLKQEAEAYKHFLIDMLKSR
jgi:tetratricopeptide (TPR) repeat protein